MNELFYISFILSEFENKVIRKARHVTKGGKFPFLSIYEHIKISVQIQYFNPIIIPKKVEIVFDREKRL